MTRKEIRELVKYGKAVDLTHTADKDKYNEIMEQEGYLETIAISKGVYGMNGALLQGHNTKKLYAITDRTTALFMFV